ncbi:MAG TPA: hypothetical protein PLD82_06295 [Spirochaetota bacterium]|nr:hypothetical protein [Spirochaetota bacterium]
MHSNSLSATGLANSRRYKLPLLVFVILALRVLPVMGYSGSGVSGLSAGLLFDSRDGSLDSRLDACLAVQPGLPPPAFEDVWPERKDPFFAAALSWFIPGLGQLYVGKPLKGGLYWLIDNTLFWTAILNVAHVDLGLERDIGFRFAIRARENLSSARIWTSVGVGLCYLAFHIYNVLDAADDAEHHNQEILLREMRRDGLSLIVTPESGSLQWSGSF